MVLWGCKCWEWWGEGPVLYFSHSDLIETTNFSLFRMNSAMNTRAIYSKAKKILYKPHIQNVIRLFPNGASIRKWEQRTCTNLEQPRLVFLSSKYRVMIVPSHEQGTLQWSIILENILPFFLWTWVLCWHLQDDLYNLNLASPSSEPVLSGLSLMSGHSISEWIWLVSNNWVFVSH